MTVQQVPGIWDYLGQAFGVVGGGLQAAKAEKKADTRYEEERRLKKVLSIAEMVKAGLMDSTAANMDPDVRASGYKFSATPQETARNIMKSPLGTAQPAPDISKYLAPTGIGSMPTPIGQTTLNKPWSPEERAYAGMPSEAAIAGDKLAGITTGLKTKYVQGGDVTPQQASAIGVKTPLQIQAEQRESVDKLVGRKAEEHIAGVLNSMPNLNTMDAAGLRRNAKAITTAAYNNYMQEAQRTGSLSGLTPADLEYTKSTFEKAIREYIDTAEKGAFELKKAAIGRGNDQMVALYRELTNTGEGYDARLKVILSDPLSLAATATPPEKLNPQLRARLEEIESLKRAASTYKSVANKVLAGKVAPKDIDTLLNTEGTSSGGPDIAGMTQMIKSGQATTADLDALVTAGQVTPEQAAQVKAQLGMQPAAQPKAAPAQLPKPNMGASDTNSGTASAAAAQKNASQDEKRKAGIDRLVKRYRISREKAAEIYDRQNK